MHHRHRRLKRQIRLEIAPLLDVIFILLIFFAVATSITLTNTGINLKLPTASATDPHDNGIAVALDASGTLYVDDTPTPLAQLKALVATKTETTPDIPIIVHADQSLPYQAIVTVLDAIRLSNGRNIILKAQTNRDEIDHQALQTLVQTPYQTTQSPSQTIIQSQTNPNAPNMNPNSTNPNSTPQTNQPTNPHAKPTTH